MGAPAEITRAQGEELLRAVAEVYTNGSTESAAFQQKLSRDLQALLVGRDPTPPASRFQLRGPDELRKNASPAWLVPLLLVEDTNVEFYGNRGSLKSFVAQNLAWSGACGRTWRHWELRTFRTLYVAAEGAQALGKRLRAWEQRTGVSVPDSHFRALTDTIPKLNVQRDVDDFLPVVTDYQPNLIVFDTWNRTIKGSENDTEVMSAYVDGMNQIRLAGAPGAVAITIHHTSR